MTVAELPVAKIAPGVNAKLAWGRGALAERLSMDAGAQYPSQTLGEELIIVVTAGSGTLERRWQDAAACQGQCRSISCRGSKRSLKAGPEGLQSFEVLFACPHWIT